MSKGHDEHTKDENKLDLELGALRHNTETQEVASVCIKHRPISIGFSGHHRNPLRFLGNYKTSIFLLRPLNLKPATCTSMTPLALLGIGRAPDPAWVGWRLKYLDMQFKVTCHSFMKVNI